MTQPVTHPIIALDDVALTLDSQSGPVNILRGISLQIPAGQSVSVVGPSGSGKSTLLMVMAGLERVSAGTVTVDGVDLGALNEDALARFRRDRVGIVFQSFHLIPTMTALENVAIPLEMLGRTDAFDAAADSLQRVGLGHRLTHYPSQLSGGEQQRVALARATVARPRIVFADEPTGNLDGQTGAPIVELMFSLARDHSSTLVLVTHDRTLAEQAERVIALHDGVIAQDRAGGAPDRSTSPSHDATLQAAQ